MSDFISKSDVDANVNADVELTVNVSAGPVVADVSSNTSQFVELPTTPSTIENAQAKEQMATDEYIQKQIQLGLQKYLSEMSAAAITAQDSSDVFPGQPSSGTRGRSEFTTTATRTTNRNDSRQSLRDSLQGDSSVWGGNDRQDSEPLETQEVRYQGRGHARARVLVNVTPAMLAAKSTSTGQSGVSNSSAVSSLAALPLTGLSETARLTQEVAMAERLNNRRETSSISYKNLYSSDRRKPHTQLPEAATFSEARSSFMGSTIPTMGLAVGLDTRELWMMTSLRAPGINGLI